MDKPVCEKCGEGEAKIKLIAVVNNKSTTRHLCEQCAAEEGVENASVAPANFPLTDFLAQMGESAEPSAGGEATCAFCGLTFAKFRETGRLGCPHCYATFETHLRGLLRRIHGGTQHQGKVYLPSDPTASERAKRLEGLRRRLQRAVESEDFERAAEIRDLIRALEPT
jgi:protein arginine kinase activator